MVSYMAPMQFVKLSAFANTLMFLGAPFPNILVYMTAAPILSAVRCNFAYISWPRTSCLFMLWSHACFILSSDALLGACACCEDMSDCVLLMSSPLTLPSDTCCIPVFLFRRYAVLISHALMLCHAIVWIATLETCLLIVDQSSMSERPGAVWTLAFETLDRDYPPIACPSRQLPAQQPCA